MKILGLTNVEDSDIDKDGICIVDEGIECICSEAFKHLDRLKKLVLPKSLKAIAEEAFVCCRNLECIEFTAATKDVTLRRNVHTKLCYESPVKYVILTDDDMTADFGFMNPNDSDISNLFSNYVKVVSKSYYEINIANSIDCLEM